jgi:lipoprotein-anchoring transpeptidase ErfK/SrfK
MTHSTRSRLGAALRRLVRFAACATLAATFSNCASTSSKELRVSVRDQKMALYDQGQLVRTYGVSTSKFGVGDTSCSNCTPIGKLKVARKIGDGMPPGMVFKSRRPTGEVIRPDAPGRDPIVTRIMWLQGADSRTANAYRRFIYIHGTPEERNIGRAASYGCIRMRSMDIIDLYSRIPEGTSVKIERGGLPVEAKSMPEYVYTPPVRPETPLRPGVSKETGVAKR